MKITRNDSERLVIVDFPFFFGFIFVAIGALAIWRAVYDALKPVHQTSEIVWCSVIGVFFILGAGVFVNRCVFDFDLRLRQLYWSRTGLFGRKGGTVPLGNITGCMVQMTVGDKGSLDYRVALQTVDGELPITATYSGGAAVACERARAAIDHALGLAPTSTPEMDDANLRNMIQRGFPIAAIALIREKRGCSLAEAKKIVDDLRQKAAPGSV